MEHNTNTRRLRTWVHVARGDHGERVAFGPDDIVPDWAAAQITNPRAWDDYEAAEDTASAGDSMIPEVKGMVSTIRTQGDTNR